MSDREMADKLRVKTDGVAATAASLLERGEGGAISALARLIDAGRLIVTTKSGAPAGDLIVRAREPEEASRGRIAQKPCPSCGGGRCRTYRIAATRRWQIHAPVAISRNWPDGWHDECDDCGYQSEIRREP